MSAYKLQVNDSKRNFAIIFNILTKVISNNKKDVVSTFMQSFFEIYFTILDTW